MLVTLTTTRRLATDLGYLLHKHPDETQQFLIAAGATRVSYPTTDELCSAALMLDIDPVALAAMFEVTT